MSLKFIILAKVQSFNSCKFIIIHFHSFASALIKREVSIYIVKELLGHSNKATTQIYSHLDNGSLSRAVNVLTGLKYFS
jgi:site-specific recombinase XerD